MDRTTAPPGWYPDYYGTWRWWDGNAWGPAAPPAYYAPPAPALAVISHLSILAGQLGIILPIVFLVTEGKKDLFTKHHATEALNFQLTFLLVSVVAMVLYVVAFFSSFGLFTSTGDAAEFGPLFGVFVFMWVAIFAISITALVLAIIGGVRAGRRRWWRYPISIRFVSGALSKDEVDALY